MFSQFSTFNLKNLLFTGLFIFSIACKTNKIDPAQPEPEPEPKPKNFVENTWIYEQMAKNYLWENKMPLEDSTDKTLEPTEYFYSLIYKEGDKASYIKDNYSEIEDYWAANLNSFGFRYTKFTDSTSALKMAISLVFKGSPAEKAGLQRGDVITKINNSSLTEGNLSELLNNSSASFSIKNATDSVYTLNISKSKFQINPLQDYRIIEWHGKKVGYWAYTQFLFNFEVETRNIFKFFKENQVDEMIVDLRFNPGGVTPNAEVIASLLGPDLGSSVMLFNGAGNKHQQAGEKTARNFTDETYNLSSLNRVFFLTSKSSASSSELVINCLKPYRNTYTVGSNTYGKDMISVVLKDETGKIPYTLMPAWVTIVNANGQSGYGAGKGITPDYPVTDNILPYKPLGDTTETLLRKALLAISPSNTATKQKKYEVQLLDNHHHFDSGSGFLDNPRYK